MIKDISADLLAYVTAEMFESTAFMFLEPAEQTPWTDAPEADALISAEVSFSHADERARLVIAASAGFSAELAGNLLGLDGDDEEAKSGGPAAVGEMANIIAGFLVAQMYGDVVIDIGPPVVGKTSGSALTAQLPTTMSSAVFEEDEAGWVGVFAYGPGAA